MWISCFLSSVSVLWMLLNLAVCFFARQDEGRADTSGKEKKKKKNRHKHSRKDGSSDKSSRGRLHKHKKKKHHRREGNDASDRGSVKREKLVGRDDVPIVKKSTGGLKSEVSCNGQGEQSFRAINLIAAGYGSESEEEGEVDYSEHQQQIRRARQIVVGADKAVSSSHGSVADSVFLNDSSKAMLEDVCSIHSDQSDDVMDVTNECDAENYLTVDHSDGVHNNTTNVEHAGDHFEEKNSSDIEIIEELTEGLPLHSGPSALCSVGGQVDSFEKVYVSDEVSRKHKKSKKNKHKSADR